MIIHNLSSNVQTGVVNGVSVALPAGWSGELAQESTASFGGVNYAEADTNTLVLVLGDSGNSASYAVSPQGELEGGMLAGLLVVPVILGFLVVAKGLRSGDVME